MAQGAYAADVGVDVRAGGLELGVDGVDVVGLQADAGLPATGLPGLLHG